MARFQGKCFPCIIIAKDDLKPLNKLEKRFREFINTCLMEEAAEDIAICIVKFINDSTREMEVKAVTPENIMKRKHTSKDTVESGKKTKHQEERDTEVNESRKEKNQNKRDQEKSRKNVNLEVSSQMMTSSSSEMLKKMDLIISMTTSLSQKVESMQLVQQNLITEQRQIIQKMEGLSAMAQCSKCLRAQYKL